MNQIFQKYIVSLLFAFILSSISLYAEEKIYIFHFKLTGSKDKELEQRVRNGMVLSILKYFPGKYKIMDDDSIQDLSKKIQKMQMSGCSDEICIQEISNAIDANELISGSINITGNRYKFEFKKTKKEEDFTQTLKSSVSEEFDVSQLDYFLNEVSKKLINPAYVINRKDAPSSLSNLDDISGITNKEKPVSDLYLETTPEFNKLVWEALHEPIEDAFELRAQKQFKESGELFFVILKSIERGLENRKDLSPLKDVLSSRAKGSLFQYFTGSLRTIDTDAQKREITDQDSIRLYEKYLKDIDSYRQDITPKELRTPILLRIARVYEAIGDSFYRSTEFSPAKENFEKALGFVDKLTQEDKKSNQAYYNSLLSKKNETDTVGKRFVENKVKSLCDTSKAQYGYSLTRRRTNAEEADNALNLSKSLISDAEKILTREKLYSSAELQTYFNRTKEEVQR